nr:zinc knuckle CX2CX4HX4C [Tanacetum cinerariifolium]
MADVSQPDIVHSYPKNGEGLNGDNNMEEVLHIHETTSNVTGSFDADKATQSNENTIVALFGVPLSSIEELDAIEVVGKKLLADVTSTANDGTGPKEDTPIVKSVSFSKLVSYAGAARLDSIKGLEDVLENGSWMIRNNPIILKKWTMNIRPCKEELSLIPVWVKIHDVPIQAMTIPTVVNNAGFQTVVNKKKNGKMGPTIVKTTWHPITQKARCDPKSHEDSQKANDDNTVHLVSKENPSKAVKVPSSFFMRGSAKNGGLQYHSSASIVHTSNPYDALDDMESDEDVEVMLDETTYLFGNNITRAT